MPIYTTKYSSPLGDLTASAENDTLTGLWFKDQKHYPANTRVWQREPDYPILLELCEWLDAYFAGELLPFTGTLAPKGSAFRQQVWQLLLQIPYGQTTTYGGLAQELATCNRQPKLAAQAVGGAVGHNPISLIIPCHRVVARDGSLTGYAGGLEKKQYLLELEREHSLQHK